MLEGKGCKEFFSSFHFDLADMNQYYVTLYAPLVGVDRSILEYGVGTILAIYGKPLSVTVFVQFLAFDRSTKILLKF